MKYIEIENTMNALQKVSNKVLPRKLSVAIVRNIEKLKSVSEFISAQRLDILKKYAIIENGEFKFTINENGQQTLAFDSQEKLNLCNSELNDLYSCSEDLGLIKVSASELDKCEESDRYDILTVQEELSLAFMLTYEE